MKLFLLILLIIIFIPIPLKIKILLSNDNYYIKFYKFTILKGSKHKGTESNYEVKVAAKKTTRTAKKAKENILPKLTKKDIFYFIGLLKNNKFKPSLKIEGHINYSVGDAGKDALIFGILNTYFPLVIWLFSIFFKVKKINMPVKPLYTDKFSGEFKANSIILVSLAQIIYIAFLLFNGVIHVKGGDIE